ncbi:hypothetical protein K1X76_02930 [bacterium]|nr:hypothetical protein [bacterium]
METKTNISLASFAKKVVFASLGSASMAKKAFAESNITGDFVNGLLSKVEKNKDVLVEMLAKEVSKFLEKVNVGEEIAKAVKGLVINVSASVDFDSKTGKSKSRITRATASKKK